ncbi:hypothetical protein BOWSER_49 [Gordonia phage Bowser]|uniref:Uncharacterized protein n=1 Tax=Gordonia phage Bowser TaxID=1838063 RepID=A0A160DF68_9CAUD|nr:hypothetical protein BH770_gp49 [Gordonia phage Bowser]ANA85444.1 hypothetical protein BOWSER_49 [Gordonia phage Bowser]
MFGFGRNRRGRRAEEEALRRAARERQAAEAHRRIANRGTTFRDAELALDFARAKERRARLDRQQACRRAGRDLAVLNASLADDGSEI